MEETTAGYTTYNIGMILIAGALIALFASLMVSGIIGYRRSREAVERVFQAKGRNPGTPVPVLVRDAVMAEQLVREFPDALRELADQFWPGALNGVDPKPLTSISSRVKLPASVP